VPPHDLQRPFQVQRLLTHPASAWVSGVFPTWAF
jgi:hypothetical protein